MARKTQAKKQAPVGDDHTPVPVEAAREIALRYKKSMVVILSYDPSSQKTHTTTYGVEPIDKERAADVGVECAKLICGEGFAERTSYEDYRFMDQGQQAKRIEELETAAKGAKLAIQSVLAFREGITDEALQEVVEVIDKTLKQA